MIAELLWILLSCLSIFNLISNFNMDWRMKTYFYCKKWFFLLMFMQNILSLMLLCLFIERWLCGKHLLFMISFLYSWTTKELEIFRKKHQHNFVSSFMCVLQQTNKISFLMLVKIYIIQLTQFTRNYSTKKHTHKLNYGMSCMKYVNDSITLLNFCMIQLTKFFFVFKIIS